MNTYQRGPVIRPMAEAMLRHRRAEDEVIKVARKLESIGCSAMVADDGNFCSSCLSNSGRHESDCELHNALVELALAEKALTPQRR